MPQQQILFDLTFPNQNADANSLQLRSGDPLFVLGANGTGKSSLMFHFSQRNHGRVRKISAHRQTWMNTDALDLTPATKLQTEQNIQNTDQQWHSRFRDDFAAQRASMTIYELIDAENVRAREIAASVDAGDVDGALLSAQKEAPITIINELLVQANIPISIRIRENERVVASKDGGPEYSAAELSDGERNALLIAANVLTAPSGTLLLIDEPERHLHRSIISPLLGQLFRHRADCGFVISTHDQDLPLEIPGARVVLLRACHFDGQNVRSWDSDELRPDALGDDSLKRELLGARRKVLFVEGTEHSLDKSLYSLIFPSVTVIPRGSGQDVERAVVGLRAGEGLHWLRAFGIADGDGYESDYIQAKLAIGVYLIPFYSVEAIYYHPQIVERVAVRVSEEVSGDESRALIRQALDRAVAAISDHTERLARKVTKKAARKLMVERLPNDEDLLKGDPVVLSNESESILSSRKKELDVAVTDGDWETILIKASVRESNALAGIAASLGFQKMDDYEKAVRHILSTDEEALRFARGLFGDLFKQLED